MNQPEREQNKTPDIGSGLAQPSGEKRFRFFWIVTVLVGCYGIYGSGIGMRYFTTDYEHVPPCPQPFYYFAHRNPYADFYRPMDAALQCIVQNNFGFETWPLSLVHLLFHAILSWLVFCAACELGLSRRAAIFASTFMLMGQASAIAVLKNDTFSQLGSTLFGFLALLLLYRDLSSIRETGRPATAAFALSVPCLLASLFFKEIGIGYFLAMVLLLTGWFLPGQARAVPWKQVAPRVLWLLAVCVFYITVRFSIFPLEIPSAERYGPGTAVSTIRNLALLFFSSSVPVSSASFFVHWQQADWTYIAVALILTALFLAVLLSGLWHARPARRWLLSALAFFFATLFPVYLFRHVGELYTYNWMPVFSLFVGAGFTQAFAQLRRLAARLLLAGFALLLLASHVLAIQSKAHAMRQNGERAEQLLQALRPWLACLPQSGKLVLVNPATQEPAYSEFLMPGFQPLFGSLGGLHYVAGRTDFDYDIVERASWVRERQPRELPLTLDNNGKIVPLTILSACSVIREGRVAP